MLHVGSGLRWPRMGVVTAEPRAAGRLWYFDLTADQRKAFWAAYLGWTLDGFDYYILSLLLVDVQRRPPYATGQRGFRPARGTADRSLLTTIVPAVPAPNTRSRPITPHLRPHPRYPRPYLMAAPEP